MLTRFHGGDKFGLRSNVIFAALLISCCYLFLLPVSASDFRQETIYQIVTDRFFDGDHGNNDPPQSSGLFDGTHTNWQCYWGGDLKGIVKKLDYLKRLGVTALWISPPVDNCNVSVSADGKGHAGAPYHGYHARDFMRIEEHFGDKRNSWKAFDRLINDAHALDMKVIVDFACNHSNQKGVGEFGDIFQDDHILALGTDDKWFHHNGSITDYNDRYQIQYQDIFNLTDLAQDKEPVDAYLKAAMLNLLRHKVDSFRLDAIKHVNWGWHYSLMDVLNEKYRPFVFGEWFEGGIKSSMWADACEFSNNSGMQMFDYPLAMALREVVANDKEFQTVDSSIYYGDQMLKDPTHLVTFFDNHDIPRLLNLNKSKDRLHQALAFILTCRGIPCITYGTEQYLFDSTSGGADPYNRPMMKRFSDKTIAFTLIKELARLRRENPAVPYGSFKRRFINNDVYVYEREFEGNVVTVAINKNAKLELNLPVSETSLSAGHHWDYLHGLLNGRGVDVKDGDGRARLIVAQKLPPSSVAVWVVHKPIAKTLILSVSPPHVHPGSIIEVVGKNLGFEKGQLICGDLPPADVLSWSENRITAHVPQSATEGDLTVKVMRGKETSNMKSVVVHSGPLIPVTFHLLDAPKAKDGGEIFVSGDTLELKVPHAEIAGAGPMLTDRDGTRLLTVSLPANKALHVKFVQAHPKSIDENEPGLDHTYTVPGSGVGDVSFTWNSSHQIDKKSVEVSGNE